MARRKKETAPVHELSPEAQALIAEGYEQVSGGAGEPWSPGLAIEGVFHGTRDSQFRQDDGEMAQLVDLTTEEGPRVFRCPAVLKNRLDNVSPGDKVRIECAGKVRTKAGRQAWDFVVLVKRNSPAPTPKLALSPVTKRKPGRKPKK